jgi:hypothetical protein
LGGNIPGCLAIVVARAAWLASRLTCKLGKLGRKRRARFPRRARGGKKPHPRQSRFRSRLNAPSGPYSLWGLSVFAILAIPAPFGWRWRKISYAVSNSRFPCTSPVRIPRDVLPCLLKTELFNLPRCSQSRSDARHD